jgi:dGTP triphosphohydrolase
VARQNAKEKRILEKVFTALKENTKLLPRYVQQRIAEAGDTPKAVVRETAHFLASLTDRATIDLYHELFTPDKRSMGQHVQ